MLKGPELKVLKWNDLVRRTLAFRTILSSNGPGNGAVVMSVTGLVRDRRWVVWDREKTGKHLVVCS